MIIQYILCISELDTYGDMISDIQGYKFNIFKNEKNEFTIKQLIAYTFGYAILGIFFYYYMIISKKSYIEQFIFASILYILWDAALFLLFDKAVPWFPVLAYDTFVVGGVGLTLASYIVNTYYSTLKNYSFTLSILYLTSMAAFLRTCYLYNPI